MKTTIFCQYVVTIVIHNIDPRIDINAFIPLDMWPNWVARTLTDSLCEYLQVGKCDNEK
jgi:hypothetical protein